MTTAPYLVDGVQLVSVGGEWCEACEQRPAVGRSIGGFAICARCAGAAAFMDEELAKEKEESAKRMGARRDDRLPVLRAAVARSQATDDAKAAIPVVGKATVQLSARNSRAEQKAKLSQRNRDRARFKCGHPRTPENTYWHKDRPGRRHFRECRTCALQRSRRAS